MSDVKRISAAYPSMEESFLNVEYMSRGRPTNQLIKTVGKNFRIDLKNV